MVWAGAGGVGTVHEDCSGRVRHVTHSARLAQWHARLASCLADRALFTCYIHPPSPSLQPCPSRPWEKKKADYQKPLIGILAQGCHYCPGRSYVAAGFVKWIEAAGARAVPIRCGRRLAQCGVRTCRQALAISRSGGHSGAACACCHATRWCPTPPLLLRRRRGPTRWLLPAPLGRMHGAGTTTLRRSCAACSTASTASSSPEA